MKIQIKTAGIGARMGRNVDEAEKPFAVKIAPMAESKIETGNGRKILPTKNIAAKIVVQTGEVFGTLGGV